MTAAEFSALMLVATATSFTPGPNTTLSTALAANRGLKASLHFVLAVPVGWGLLFTLCAFGIGNIVTQIPILGYAVKYLGIAYLIWLGSKLWKSAQLSSANESQLNVTFFQGILLQFLNIKAWMLALTVASGWLAGQADFYTRYFMILPLMLGFAFFSNLLYASVGSLLREWLKKGQRLLMFNRGMACILFLTSLWLISFPVQQGHS